MADKRAYFKLDVGYLTNPKVAAASLESQGAVILHIGCIAYAAQHLTDGIVPIALVCRLTGTTSDDAEVLRRHGLLHLDGGNAHVHDFLEHQRSSSEVKGATDKAKAAADARWSDRADAQRNASSNALSMPDALHVASESAMPRERGEIGERESAAPVRKRPARPLPDDWRPNPRHTSKAQELGVDVSRAAETFRNHAGATDRRLADWDKAFTNWLLKEKPSTVTTLPQRRTSEQIRNGWMFR